MRSLGAARGGVLARSSAIPPPQSALGGCGIAASFYLAPPAGRGRREAPGEGDSPRVPMRREAPHPTLSPQARGEGEEGALPDRPDERRFAVPGGLQMHGNVASAACGEAVEQALQHLCAGGAAVADAFHQLPCLLLNLEAT